MHARSYRESSLIADFFTLEYGRLSAVARGVRGQKKKAILQPFSLFLISCAGSGELKTLKSYELPGTPTSLVGDNLFIGLYVNELLVRLLGRFDPMRSLFNSYENLLGQLSKQGKIAEQVLRRFELKLLADLGYGIVFDYEVSTGTVILSDNLYKYSLEGGFEPAQNAVDANMLFRGTDLLAIAADDFSRSSAKVAAKKIVRTALKPLLGGKPLNSRELFVKF